jgi:hypothetical protein
MYGYGHQVLPTMAVGTFLLYVYTSVKKRSAQKSWDIFAVAGVTTLSMVPFTWIFMVPMNNELFRFEEVSKVDPLVMGIVEAKELVVKWAWLHVTRLLMPVAGSDYWVDRDILELRHVERGACACAKLVCLYEVYYLGEL